MTPHTSLQTPFLVSWPGIGLITWEALNLWPCPPGPALTVLSPAWTLALPRLGLNTICPGPGCLCLRSTRALCWKILLSLGLIDNGTPHPVGFRREVPSSKLHFNIPLSPVWGSSWKPLKQQNCPTLHRTATMKTMVQTIDIDCLDTWGWGLNRDPRIENGENEDCELTASMQLERRSVASRGDMTEMADTEVSHCLNKSHNSDSHCYHWCLLLPADPLALGVKGVAAIWT